MATNNFYDSSYINVFVDNLMSSSETMRDFMVMTTDWSRFVLDEHIENHCRLMNILRRDYPTKQVGNIIYANKTPLDTLHTSDKHLAQLAFEKIKIDPKDSDASRFVVKDFVCAAKLMIQLRMIPRSNQHALLKNILHLVKDKWASSWEHNTNKDMKRLAAHYSYLKIPNSIMNVSDYERKYKYRRDAHVFPQMFSTMEAAKSFFSKAEKTMDKVETTTENTAGS
jgi:hypothetical protein